MKKNDEVMPQKALPLFKDMAPGTWDRLPPQTIGTDSLVVTGKNGDYIYVITDNHELLVMPAETDGFPEHHATMAFRRPVYAAGELKFVNGKCFVNNQSGGFQPKGEHLKPYVLRMLEKNGIRNAEFNYVYESERIDLEHPPENMIMPKKSMKTEDSDEKTSLGESISIAAKGIKHAIFPDLAAAELKDHPVNSPPSTHGSHDESHSTVLGDAAHQVSEGLGIVSKGLHVMHMHLPGPLHQAERIAEVYTEMAHNHTTGDSVEDKVCGLATGFTKLVVGGAAVASVSLPGLNEVAIPLLAEEVSAVVIALSTGASLHQAVDAAVAPCADVVKKSCHTAFANNRKFRANNPIPEINGMNDALFALNPTDPRNSGKKPKRVSIHPKPINFRELFANVVNQLKEVAPTMVDPNSHMTKMLRALEPSNNVDDERFKCDRKKYVWPKIKSKYERETQVSSTVASPSIKEVLKDDSTDKSVEGYQQQVQQFSCIKDRSRHRFVTPDYVSKNEIEKQKESGEYLYIISDKGKLLIAKQESLSVDDSGRSLPVSHMDIARGKKVIGAGTIRVHNGKIASIDNNAPDYEPIDMTYNGPRDKILQDSDVTLKNSTEHAFLMNGFSEAKDKFVYSERFESLPAMRRAQAVSANNNIQAIHEKKEKLLSSQSIFSSGTTYIDRMTSLNTPSTLVTQPPRPSQSLLAPVDFAARKANFSQLIYKSGAMQVSRASSTQQQQFFGGSSSQGKTQAASGGSTLNVSNAAASNTSISSSNYSCPIVKGPAIRIGIVLKDGSTDWGCHMPIGSMS